MYCTSRERANVYKKAHVDLASFPSHTTEASLTTEQPLFSHWAAVDAGSDTDTYIDRYRQSGLVPSEQRHDAGDIFDFRKNRNLFPLMARLASARSRTCWDSILFNLPISYYQWETVIFFRKKLETQSCKAVAMKRQGAWTR